MPKTTHGMARTRFYKIWRSAKNRALDQNNKNYGARGIWFSEYWFSFEGFKNDMYESYLSHVEEYGEKNTTLDRINNNDWYYKENCRWATTKEQASNKRYKHHVLCIATSPNGEIIEGLTMSQIANEYGIDARKISDCCNSRRRTHKGWKFKYA